jgi:hypothetical protein
MIKEEGIRELSKVIVETSAIARLNLRENVLKDSVMKVLA